MSKKDKEEIDFELADNLEEVPYNNNDGDLIQDSLKEIEKQTKNLQNEFISQNNNNVVNIDFKKNKK